MIDRRALLALAPRAALALAAGVALPIAAGAAADGVGDHPDADICRLGVRLEAALVEQARLDALADSLDDEMVETMRAEGIMVGRALVGPDFAYAHDRYVALRGPVEAAEERATDHFAKVVAPLLLAVREATPATIRGLAVKARAIAWGIEDALDDSSLKPQWAAFLDDLRRLAAA